MSYKSPIHILPDYDFTRLNPKGLKRLRKELSLQFELKQSTQIVLNKHTFDKETLLKNIAELTENGHFHQQIFEQPLLLDFLENGNIAFFESTDLATFFEEQSALGLLDFLRPYFAAQLNQTIYFLVTNAAYSNLANLKIILAHQENIPTDYWEGAFVKVHQHLVATKDKLAQLHENNQVFEKRLGWVVATKAFNQVFHFTYLKKLAILPYDLDGQLLNLTETLLHITRDILQTNQGGNILKIDKGLLLDIRDLLAFAYKKMKHKNILDLLSLIDDALKNPYYTIWEMGALFFRSMS